MIVGKDLEYRTDSGFLMRGFLAYQDTYKKQLPTVLIAPDWSGRNELYCEKAIELADLGYVALTIDVYGDGKVAESTDEKISLITELRENRGELLSRLQAALAVVRQQSMVDQDKIAIIGYCFGGLCSLDLARSGANIKGAVSFHGLLDAPDESQSKEVISKVLVLHGHNDTLVSNEQISDFHKEMTENNVDWQMYNYGIATHAFTNPNANDPEMNLKYCSISAKRSWQAALNFFDEIFAEED